MLRVVRRIAEESPLTVKATFMGAHAFPERFRDNHEGYVSEIINEMIPAVAAEGLAEYIDVFCEEGFFSKEQSDRILAAGRKFGLKASVHANQMSCSGGVEVGVKYDAASVSHLEYAGDAQFEVLEKSETIANLLPGATFFLDMEYPDARRMLQYDIPVALAITIGVLSLWRYEIYDGFGLYENEDDPEEVINLPHSTAHSQWDWERRTAASPS